MLCLLVFLVLFSASLASDVNIEDSSIPLLDGRIVGGKPVNISSFPYQLSLEYLGRHICGASIISRNVALTAGHCTENYPTRFLTVRAGTTYVGRGGKVVQVAKVYRHPKYNREAIDYDVALLRLKLPLTTGRPIKLPVQGDDAMPGSTAVVSGWGRLNEAGSLPLQLQAVVVPIISKKECQKAYRNNKITNRMLCAGFSLGGRDACQGDSGGPLRSYKTGKQIGIVSWGVGCARPNYPGVYTNIASVRNWIKSTVSL